MSVPGLNLDPSLSDLYGGLPSDYAGIDPVTITPSVLAGSSSSGSSGSDFWGSLSNAIGGALGQIAGTGIGVGTQVADYGLASLGSQAARGIGQSAGNVAPQFVPYPVPAPSAATISPNMLLLVIALAGVGVLLMVKGK